MAELDRRLRLAVRLGRDEFEDHDVQTPMAAVPRAEPASGKADQQRDKKGPEPSRPAVAPASEKIPEIPVSFDGGSGDQPGPVAVDPMPSVEELSQRLPPEVRTALDELFRAQWTGVRRLRPEDLRH
jgi:hypothetical protein